jgi:hypothetical protein
MVGPFAQSYELCVRIFEAKTQEIVPQNGDSIRLLGCFVDMFILCRCMIYIKMH